MGVKMPHCGFLVVKDLVSPDKSLQCIMGINKISQFRQLVNAEFDTTLGARVDSEWRNVFQKAQTCTVEKTCCMGCWETGRAHTHWVTSDHLGKGI